MPLSVRPLAVLLALVALVTVPQAVAQATFAIDRSASHITYAMEHPAHHWTGTSARVSGSIRVDDGRVTGGRVSAPVVTFDSGNRSRDSNMASDTEAYLYPDVVFEAQTVTLLPAAQQTADRNATILGRLTFHNVRRDVTIPARIDLSGATAHIRGRFEVTLTEFGLERPSLLRVRARDWIGLELDLVARRG
jgi:polyisoprenoid-binding protein YceI